MFGSRWFWAVTLGSLLAISVVAVPAAGWFSGGHSPFAPAQGGSDHPTAPGWHNETGQRYSVTFTESGLPAGTNWSVSVWRSWSAAPGTGASPSVSAPSWGWGISNGSANSSIGFELFNGSYQYIIPNASGIYVPDPSSGVFSVNGSAVSIAVTFSHAALYTVSFVESGLPNGTFWSVVLAGGFGGWGGWGPTPLLVRPACGLTIENGSNQTTVSFLLPNGTYDFFIGNVSAVGALYVPTPSSGNVTVNGSGASVPVSFQTVPLYALAFDESGLPNGTVWSVAIWSANGVYGWNATTNASLTFWVPDGLYNFSVSNVTSGASFFVASPSYGNVSINGSGATVSVTFAAVALYPLTFEETGLPNGAFWSVVLSGANGTWLWNGTNSTNVTFWLPSGSYNFSVGDVWTWQALYVPSPANGTVVVNGSGVTVPVVFSTEPAYTVSFVESGLPAGTNWSVVVFERPGPCAAFGCWNDSAAPEWGGVQYNGSNTTTINFTLQDGTYSFYVPVVCNNSTVYLPSPATGNVTVNGTGVTVSIAFAPLVFTTVIVNETGLPNGTVWFVAVEPSTGGWFFVESNNTTATFVLPSGTYGLDIGPVWVGGVLYTPTPAAESITVSGGTVTVDVTFGSG